LLRVWESDSIVVRLLEQFRFVDPGPLIDGELELVAPAERWVEPFLATLNDPRTRDLVPGDATITRDQLVRFVRDHPLGRQAPDGRQSGVPAYHFWMRLDPSPERGIEIAGTIGLRVGNNANIENYLGHVGYNVYPPLRGRHYARRAVRLLLPMARRLGLNPLWITCNPENVASRRTCESAGGRLVEIVDLPREHALYRKGERAKCRYRFDL
jgi:tagatose 1,6-diphosphate aldolase